MKLFQLPIKLTLVLIWFLIAANPVRSQSGNMSDITMPNPGEVTPETPNDSEPTTDEPVAGDGSEPTTDEPVAGDDSEPTTDEPVAGDDSEPTTDEPVAEDDTVTDDTPMEEAIVDGEEIPTEDNITEDNTDTSDREVVNDDDDIENPNQNRTANNNNDSDAAQRNADNQNVMEAIANNGDSEPEVITSENDFGTTLGENTAGDSNANIQDNAVSEAGSGTTETDSPVQSDSVVDPETNINANSEQSSESIAEDSVEQNLGTANDSDSTQTITDNVSETDSVATQETTTDNVDAVEETIPTDNVSETDSVVTQETTTDNVDAVEEASVGDDVSETDSVSTQETTTDDVDAVEEASVGDDVSETDSVATEDELVERTTEELEEKSVTASEEGEEEAVEEIVEENETTEAEAEKEAVAEEEAEEEIAEEEAEEPENSQDLGQEIDRVAYEVQVQESPTDIAIQMQEEFQLTQLMGTSGLQLYGQIPSVKEISDRLGELGAQTGKNPAFINISLQSNQLEAFVVLPDDAKTAKKENSLVASTDLNKIDSSTTSKALTLRETIKDTSRKDLIATATKFREEVSDSSKLNQSSYMKSSQELYKLLIEPIEAELEANDIDILVFSMDSGLRLLPLAALHDGEQFLIEKYAVATVPSFGLTDTRYVSLDKSSILAMGASEFDEQAALPTMPIELNTIVSEPRQGEVFINEQFTIENFKAQNRREIPFPIVHLGTHAEFKAGSLDDSYIQFYNNRLKIPQLQDLSDELGWNSDATPIELLVLSACETALGDEKAELGFAGLAVQAGVKSALASLWYVSDVGTLALMGEFYDQLGDTLIKAEALRQTQLKMLQGSVKVNDKQVELSNGQNLGLPPEFPEGTLTLDHPYFWSSFTLIGNWN